MIKDNSKFAHIGYNFIDDNVVWKLMLWWHLCNVLLLYWSCYYKFGILCFRPIMRKFAVNDRVMAKWPGSSLWFEGTVVDFNDIEYQIRFNDDGKSEYVLKLRDVKVRNSKNYYIYIFSLFSFIFDQSQ